MGHSNSHPQETRDRIVYSALEIFSEKGYDSSTISEICKKAEITKGALYWHFKDKLDLYKELIKLILEGIIAVVNDLKNEADSPLERFRIFNKNVLALIQGQDFYQKALLMFLRELRTDRIGELDQSLEILSKRYDFGKIIQEAIDAKELVDNLSSAEYIELYKSIIGSLVINWLINGKKFDLCEKGERYFEHIFRLDLEKERL